MESRNQDYSDTWLYWYWGKEGTVEAEISGLVERFQISGVRTILDIGCGTGRHSIFLGRKGFKVFGFDRSTKAVERAIELATSGGTELNLITWDMNEFPYPYLDGFFSAVISTKVIHHATKKEIKRIAKEISRITDKKAGFLFLDVPTIDKLRSFDEATYEKIEEGTIVFHEGDERGVVHHYFTEQELLSTFSDFRALEIHVRDEHYCFTGVRKSSEIEKS